MQHAVLQINNISYTREQQNLFLNLTFAVCATEIFLIKGPNGSGKSTLLRMLAGLSTPSSGNILWNQQSIFSVEFRENLHYIGHQNGIKLGLTVAENLQLMAHFSQQKPIVHAQKILKKLSLMDYYHREVTYLSAGLKRRLALAKLFIFPKKIWILDEPLTALDVQSQQFFFEQMRDHVEQNGMIIMSSHHTIPLPAAKIIELGVC